MKSTSNQAASLRTDRDITLAAMDARQWEVVKLKVRGKSPWAAKKDDPWTVTTESAVVDRWLTDGFNIGLVCHERTGVAVLDPDKMAWADMVDTLGQPSRPWVITGSGKLHYYIAWTPDLPAKLTWQSQIIGEIQRGPGQQQVVLPPSTHPDTGLPYRWITASLMPRILCEPIDPIADPLSRLPGLWLTYLQHAARMRETRRNART